MQELSKITWHWRKLQKIFFQIRIVNHPQPETGKNILNNNEGLPKVEAKVLRGNVTCWLDEIYSDPDYSRSFSKNLEENFPQTFNGIKDEMEHHQEEKKL